MNTQYTYKCGKYNDDYKSNIKYNNECKSNIKYNDDYKSNIKYNDKCKSNIKYNNYNVIYIDVGFKSPHYDIFI